MQRRSETRGFGPRLLINRLFVADQPPFCGRSTAFLWPINRLFVADQPPFCGRSTAFLWPINRLFVADQPPFCGRSTAFLWPINRLFVADQPPFCGRSTAFLWLINRQRRRLPLGLRQLHSEGGGGCWSPSKLGTLERGIRGFVY